MGDHMTDSSYPFLSISRRHNCDYGLVLSYADYLIDMNTSSDFWQEQACRQLSVAARAEIAKEAERQHRIKTGCVPND